MLMIVLFFESCIFPIIFALTLRGLGRHTKRGASFLVSSVCGGAVGPVILGNVADHIGTRKAMCIPLIFFAIALASDGAWALTAGTARAWFAGSPRRLSRLTAGGGVMMIGLGGTLALSGSKA